MKSTRQLRLLDDASRCRSNVITNYSRHGISKLMVLSTFPRKAIFKPWETKNLKKIPGCTYNFERENMLKSHALQIRLENSYKTIITHFLAWKRSSNHYAHCLNIDRKQNCIGVKNLTAGITSYASKRWIGLKPILSFSFLNGESIAFSSFGFELLQISCIRNLPVIKSGRI